MNIMLFVFYPNSITNICLCSAYYMWQCYVFNKYNNGSGSAMVTAALKFYLILIVLSFLLLLINFLIEKFIWQLIEVRYLLILWLVLIPSLTIHPENGSLFPQWLKGIPAREQSPSYLMHKIGEYVITYPKINDNTMSLQSRQQNDIKNWQSFDIQTQQGSYCFGPSPKSKPLIHRCIYSYVVWCYMHRLNIARCL